VGLDSLNDPTTSQPPNTTPTNQQRQDH
jgi:hypothetical protein